MGCFTSEYRSLRMKVELFFWKVDTSMDAASLSDTLSKLLAGYRCQKQPIFGSLVYFVNDNMFTGVKGGKVFLRLCEEDRAVIKTDCDEALPFEPRPNFFMREYVSVPEAKLFDSGFMSKWLQRSYAYVASLPPKIRKPRSRK
jgi:TfoX/Sxy family transcriptional regulator of competence genes